MAICLKKSGLFLTLLMSLLAISEFAQATYSSQLSCAGTFSGTAVFVKASPLSDYHNRNLTVEAEGQSITFHGLRDNRNIDMLQTVSDFNQGLFFVAAQSSSDLDSAITLHGIPGTFRDKKSVDVFGSEMITSIRFTAVLSGRDPRKHDRGMSRDFYNDSDYSVTVLCTFTAEE